MASSDPYEIEIVNAPRAGLYDVYHLLLRAPWWADLLGIAGVFLGANALFALAYSALGGVANASRPADYFFFSVQTMGTIGYGVMYPQTTAANALVVAEAVFGLILVALFTGLIFAKFSVARARVRFAEKMTLAPVDGVPTLMMRAGNLRSNTLVEARVRVALVRTEKTREGTTVYRMYDLKLARDSTPLFTRAWTVMHSVDEASPLKGATPESLERDEVEVVVTLVGTDETSAQSVHARYRYFAGQIVFGARHADVLFDVSKERMRLDLARFDLLEPTAPVDGFPWPRAG